MANSGENHNTSRTKNKKIVATNEKKVVVGRDAKFRPFGVKSDVQLFGVYFFSHFTSQELVDQGDFTNPSFSGFYPGFGGPGFCKCDLIG